jgi:hypothetical protein
MTNTIEPQWEPTPHSSQSSSTEDEPPRPAERYGAPRTGMSLGRKFGLAAVGLCVFGGVVSYIGWQQAHPQIQGTVVKFAPGTNSVTVTFEVDKPADRAAMCVLVAEDVSHAVIGSANVPVPAGRARSTMAIGLDTTGNVNTAIVQSCSLL